MTHGKTPDDDAPEPDPATLARKSHPVESKDAAEAIGPRLAALRAETLGYLTMAPGLTTNELAAKFNLRDPRHIGRRLPELCKLGEAHRGDPRPCRITNRMAATWYPGA